MKIEIVAGEDEEAIATFIINGIDEIAESELQKKDGVTKPRVTLSFELSRSGLIQLNKAEAKVEETYYVDVPVPKNTSSSKKNKTSSEESETTSESDETIEEVEVKPKTPEKVAKKRIIPYPLNRIDKTYHGPATMSKEQIQNAKDRLRWYERKDEERARTDKAKNDFESVIYSMRDWLNDYGEAHMPYVGSADALDELLSQLSAAEEWLLDGEGETASYVEYMEKFQALNGIYQQLKTRKEEHSKRPQLVAQSRRRMEELYDSVEVLKESKPWINITQIEDALDRLAEINGWLEEQITKQKQTPLHEDPVLRSSDVDLKITRANSIYTRLSAIPKPKEKKPVRKGPKSFRMDNITINGNNGDDINLEDFIKFDNNNEDYEDTKYQNS